VRIAGIEKNSFRDYPGRLAAVLFTPGCNLDCFYCHNRHLLGGQPWFDGMPPRDALDWLARRRAFLEAVVISGGEPTLQPDLADFIRQVRALGYPVKLDTNGTRPHVLAALIEADLLDYVAMDVKAPQEKYEAFCGVPVDHSAINASIDLLLCGHIDYEFRTTAVPQLTEDDLLAIARRIRGAKRFVLQQYRKPEARRERADPRLDATPRSSLSIVGVVEELQEFVQRCDTRGFASEQPAQAALSVS